MAGPQEGEERERYVPSIPHDDDDDDKDVVDDDDDDECFC